MSVEDACHVFAASAGAAVPPPPPPAAVAAAAAATAAAAAAGFSACNFFKISFSKLSNVSFCPAFKIQCAA